MTNTFLDRVLAEKRREVEQKKVDQPLAELERLAAAAEVRDFEGALSGGVKIIAEIKKRSPRVSAFRQQGPPERLAAVYEANGAAAISIVTDARHFGTQLSDVASVRSASRLPVLVKDFVVDPYQVLEACAAGADAVLLIARIFSSPSLAALLNLATDLGLCALVECHDEEELSRALAAGAHIVGINSRDLGSLSVSLDVTGRLIPKIPQGILSVAESGISSYGEIEALSALGADAFLIGGALLNAPDPGDKLRELTGIESATWPATEQES